VSQVIHLRQGGTSILARLDKDALPCLLHWGPDLGELSSAELDQVLVGLEAPLRDSVITSQETVALLPQHSSGWTGRPGLMGSRNGRSWSVAFTTVEHRVEDAGAQVSADGPSSGLRLFSRGIDPGSCLEVDTELELLPTGLVRVRATVANTGTDDYEVVRLEPALPVPAEAEELLDMAGRHSHERSPQRRPFGMGQWVREAWGGRPGHDSATVLCAGSPNFGFRRGRVWGVHLAYSGNQSVAAELSSTGWRLLRGGELLLPGEMTLSPGESYSSPWLYGSWGDGLDELSMRFHRHLRSRPQHPASPRPVILNTWEAVYFDHDQDKLLDLAERAARLGIERFVLDDGWFKGRRDDTTALGDWHVDEHVWPHGLGPLVEKVQALGMDFGLWVEPEMISPNSDLARAHPEWLFQTDHGPGIESRSQHVLDLGHPEAYSHTLEQVSSLVTQLNIRFLKWDHNRALIDAGHSPHGTPGVHAQTAAVYRMMAELKSRHRELEIESCCGGGGRLDLGILEFCDRVWVSDCIDAHERHRLVRWTGLTIPPELMGTHVGSGVDHTTGRRLHLDFRAGTAFWGHMGVEWDLTEASDDELARLGDWVAYHKQMRDLLHTGDVVNADLTDPALDLMGVVAGDGREAIYRLSALDHTLVWPPGRVTLPGLRADLSYHVTVQMSVDHTGDGRWPAWTREGVVLSGRLLETAGLHSHSLHVDELVLIHAQAL
jgi:alpha-galactosidase